MPTQRNKPEAQPACLSPLRGPSRPVLRFLGTGTSAGVPILGCQCPVCRSEDPRDRRLRTAALLLTRGERILIDAGPDIRQQLLPLPFRPLDAILLTHIHYDHAGGLDDLRGFCHFGDLNVYADTATATALRRQMPYCFAARHYPGSPRLRLHKMEPNRTFAVGNTQITPVSVMHGKLPILGFRIGSLAYITDMKTIDPDQTECLRGVETLVVNALRWEAPHHSHMLVSDALDFISSVGPRHAYIVHVTHQIGKHDEAQARLPQGVSLAYDGLEITL